MPLGSLAEHTTFENSPFEGERGRVTLKGENTAGQDETKGDGGVNGKKSCPPRPIGEERITLGKRHPIELDAQLKGGGVLEGVGEKEEVCEGVKVGVGVLVQLGANVKPGVLQVDGQGQRVQLIEPALE